MKTLLKVIGFILAALILVIIAAPFLIPVDHIFNKVSQTVEEATGRTLTIKGEKKLSVFPSLKLKLTDVHFANIEEGSQPDMVSIHQLSIHIPYLSLLSGKLKLEKFVINEPNIFLEKMPNGLVNWRLFDAVTAEQTQNKGAGSMSLPAGFDIRLGKVAIYGGKFKYVDHQANKTTELTDLKLTFFLPSIRKALTVKGGLSYMGQAFEIDAQLRTPEKLIAGADFELKSRLESELMKLTFEGKAAKAGKDFSGVLEVKGDSVKEILKWQNIPLEAKPEALNQFEVVSNVRFTNKQLSLTKLNAALDKLDIKGKAQVNFAKHLSVNADIDLGMLDLNPYLPESSVSSTPTQSDAPAQPIVWDKSEIDLSALNSLNAVIKVRSSGLQIKKITLGENSFSFNLKNGIVAISIDEFNAYEGNGKGKIEINAARKPYQISTGFDLSGIQAEPLLTDAVDFNKLMGQGQLSWQFNTTGISQKTFIEGLSGELDFSLANGAVKGANIAAMIRTAQSLFSRDSSTGLEYGFDKSQKTDFSELIGNFTFKQGNSNKNNLSLKSPLLRVTGKGNVNMAATFINYRLVTDIVSSIEGQGATDNSTGFKIPIRIKGPFHDVKIKLDIEDALKNKIESEIKGKEKEIKDKVEVEIKNKESEIKDKIEDELKKLFR